MAAPERSAEVLRVFAVIRNGHNHPDGTPIRGVKLLTSQGVIELWEDSEEDRLGVEMYIKSFYRGRVDK